MARLSAGVDAGHYDGYGVQGDSSNDGYSGHGPPADKLFVFPWQVYPDMVVFDWLIRL